MRKNVLVKGFMIAMAAVMLGTTAPATVMASEVDTQQEAVNEDKDKEEAAKKEAEKKEAERKEAERKEAERKEAERKEAERKAAEEEAKKEATVIELSDVVITIRVPETGANAGENLPEAQVTKGNDGCTVKKAGWYVDQDEDGYPETEFKGTLEDGKFYAVINLAANEGFTFTDKTSVSVEEMDACKIEKKEDGTVNVIEAVTFAAPAKKEAEPEEKTVEKKEVKGTETKTTTVKKTADKKAAEKKAAEKKAAEKKAAEKKAAEKKAAEKKAAEKKAAEKKAAEKKAAEKKAAEKKAAENKTTAEKKATAKKTEAKEAATEKAAVERTEVKKEETKKTEKKGSPAVVQAAEKENAAPAAAEQNAYRTVDNNGVLIWMAVIGVAIAGMAAALVAELLKK